MAHAFYAGIVAFKGYMRRVHGYAYPYDWADLAPRERKRFAQREAQPRERRSVSRV